MVDRSENQANQLTRSPCPKHQKTVTTLLSLSLGDAWGFVQSSHHR